MRFIILVEGSRFRVVLDGKPKSVGFFASRVVEAQDIDRIDEHNLFHRLREELRHHHVSVSDTSNIRISEVRKISESLPTAPTGFSFFEENGIATD